VNRRSLATILRVIAIVLLMGAAFRLAIGLDSSVGIDETTQNSGMETISHRFAVDWRTATIGLVGVVMFWSSFGIRSKRG
jgi:hypothetical protein